MARSRGPLLLLLAAVAGNAPPKPIPLEVEYAGCKAVWMPGPVCGLDEDRKLQLWVGAPPDARIEIQVDGRKIDVTAEPIRDGQGFSLVVPSEATRMDVLARARQGQARWSLRLADSWQAGQVTSRDLLGGAQEAASPLHGLIQNYDLAEARKMLDSLSLPPEAPAESRCIETFYRGLLAEKEGDYRSAFAEIQQAVEIAERVEEEDFRWMSEEVLAILLRGVGRSYESAELFERLVRMSETRSACDRARLLNNQAWSTLLAREAGESVGDPTPVFERALTTYELCEDFTPGKRLNILLNVALAHLQESRLAQAKDVLGQARGLEAHATLLQTLWWLDLEARIALREGRPAAALTLFERLADLALRTGSAGGRLRAAFGQARSHQALGHRTTALETLREAEALLDEQSLQIPLHEGRETFMATRQAIVNVHVDLLLEENRNVEALAVARHARSRMLRQLERSDRLANLTPDRRAEWERLLTDYQQQRAALEERARDDWKLPADRLRREQSTRMAEAEAAKKLLDGAFLLLGDPGEQPGAAPPPPRPGELILAYAPLPRGWVGFAADGKTVAVHRFELPSGVLLRPEELSRRLLLPFRASIARAKRLRILSSGPLQDVDFHALPFAGDVLLASYPLTYGLDLPVPSDPVGHRGRNALLVADPRDDLPGALEEVRVVKNALRAWSAEELKGAQASAEAVRGRLAGADLLHYAGHGTFSGFGGWESSLLLAEETRLTLGDLLALERVPSWVVLSGCDTGRSATETPVESLGLAHAFLLAGSQAVVASTRPADDREVPEFFSELYELWSREQDLAVALQLAQLSWRKRNPEADWPGFRLFVP